MWLDGRSLRFLTASNRWQRLVDLPKPLTWSCVTRGGSVTVYAPNRADTGDTDTDFEVQHPVVVPHTTAYRASVLQADGSWQDYPNPFDGGPAPTSVLSFCTRNSLVVVGDEPGHTAQFAFAFTPSTRQWRRLKPPPRAIGYPEGWPSRSGALLTDPEAGTFLFDEGASTWGPAKVSIGPAGSAAVSRRDMFFGLVYSHRQGGSLGSPRLEIGAIR